MRKPDPNELPPESSDQDASTDAGTQRSFDELLESLADHGRRWLHELSRGLRLRGDLARERFQRVLVRVILTAAVAALGLAAGATAVVLLLVGSARALSAALQTPTWLGSLLVGALTLALLVAAVGLSLRRRSRKRLEHYEHKYSQPREVPTSGDPSLARPLGR